MNEVIYGILNNSYNQMINIASKVHENCLFNIKNFFPLNNKPRVYSTSQKQKMPMDLLTYLL
jgi:hypothetical protein